MGPGLSASDIISQMPEIPAVVAAGEMQQAAVAEGRGPVSVTLEPDFGPSGYPNTTGSVDDARRVYPSSGAGSQPPRQSGVTLLDLEDYYESIDGESEYDGGVQRSKPLPFVLPKLAPRPM